MSIVAMSPTLGSLGDVIGRELAYHVDLDEPLLYHLALNTEQPAVSEGARIIREALQSQRFQATSGSLRESGT